MRSDKLEDIRLEAIKFFSSLLRRDDHGEEDSLLESIPSLVSEEWNSFLLSPFSEEEIKREIFGLGGDRAPGPDGFPAAFF